MVPGKVRVEALWVTVVPGNVRVEADAVTVLIWVTL